MAQFGSVKESKKRSHVNSIAHRAHIKIRQMFTHPEHTTGAKHGPAKVFHKCATRCKKV